MLGFFRRIINSKFGLVITFIVLGVIALAFAASDITNLSTGSGGITGNDVARIGDEQVTAAELRQRAQDDVEAARQQQPTADIAQYLAAGGLDRALEGMIATTALAEFGRAQGMVVSERLVEGQIASIPGLQGPTGKFDENLFRRLLAERRLTEAQVRDDVARSIYVSQLVGPTQGASQVPAQMALPYASLLLEQRAGQIGFIPAAAVPQGAAPTNAELQAFYTRNRARYRLPERRQIRIARVSADQVRAQATPSEADVARQYATDGAKYQPTERRTITQVIVADRAGADALAARVRGGQTLAAAAQAAGLSASTLPAVTRAAYATQTSAAVADAVFGAARGAIAGPVRGSLGFVVARIDAVEQVAGRTLDQVRGEITAALTQRRTAEALATLREKLDEALVDNGTFDEVVTDAKLQAQTTPPLAPGAVDPLNPAAQPDPALVPLVTAAFALEEGDAPQLVPTGTDGSFAVVGVGRILPAAIRPLAEIRDRVATDFTDDRRRQAARRIANETLARVNRGANLAQALRTTNLSLPPVRPISAARGQLAQVQGGAEPALALMFSIPQGAARVLEAPGRSGWLIVKLDTIRPGDARRTPGAVEFTRNDIGRVIGREYAEQFARAARNAIGVTTDPTALARVKADLSGNANN
jgi:peptidyl-prolyl cis-trans isomerase D